MNNGVLALGIAATLTPLERRVLIDHIRGLSGAALPGVKLGRALIPSGASIEDITAVTNAVQLLALGKMAQGMAANELDEMSQSLISGNPVITSAERAKQVGLSIPPQVSDAIASIVNDPRQDVAQGAMDVLVGAVFGSDCSDEDAHGHGDYHDDVPMLTFGDVLEGGEFAEGGLFKKKDGSKRKLFSGKVRAGIGKTITNVASAAPIAKVVGMASSPVSGPVASLSQRGYPTPQEVFTGQSPPFPHPIPYPGRVPIPDPGSEAAIKETTARLRSDISKMVESMKGAEAELRDQAMEFANTKRNYARVQTARAALVMPDQMANLVAMYPIEMTSLDALTLSVLPYVQASGNESVTDWWRNFSTTLKSSLSGGKLNIDAQSDPLKMAGTFMSPMATGDVHEHETGKPSMGIASRVGATLYAGNGKGHHSSTSLSHCAQGDVIDEATGEALVGNLT